MKTKHLSLTCLSSLCLGALLVSTAIQASEAQKPVVADRRPSISMIGQQSIIDPQHLPTVEELEDSLKMNKKEGYDVKEFEDFSDWIQGLIKQNDETTQSSYAPILKKISAHIEAIQKEGSFEYFENQYYLLKKDDSTTNKFEKLNTEIGRILEQVDLADSERKRFKALQKRVIAQIKSLHTNKKALKKEANEKHKASHSNANPDFTAADKAIRTIKSIRAMKAHNSDTTRIAQAGTVAATAILKTAQPHLAKTGTSEKLAGMIFDPLAEAADSVAQSKTLQRASLAAEVAECIQLNQADKFDALLEAVSKAKDEELGTSVAPSIDQVTLYNKLKQDLLAAKGSAPAPGRADSVAGDAASEAKLKNLEQRVDDAIKNKAADQYLTLLGEIGRAKKELSQEINESNIALGSGYKQLQQKLAEAQQPTDQEESTAFPASPVQTGVPHGTPKEPGSSLSPQSTLDPIPFAVADTIFTPAEKSSLHQEPATTTPSIKDGEKAPSIDVVIKSQEAPQPSKKALSLFTRLTNSAKKNKFALGCIGLTVAGLVGYRYGNNITKSIAKYFKKLSMVRIAR